MANGQVVAFIAQIAYWLAMVILLGYAVWQYKRWVNFQLGTGRSGKLRTDNVLDEDGDGTPATPTDKKKAIPVEEFVE